MNFYAGYYENCVGIEKEIITDNKVKIYPSPANDYIVLQNIPDNSIVEILDILGNIQLTADNVYKNKTIDISRLHEGLYFIKLNSSYSNIKFIKK